MNTEHIYMTATNKSTATFKETGLKYPDNLHKEVQVQDQASPPQEIKNALFFSL